VAGIVLAASGAAAHDVYDSVWRRGNSTEQEEIRAGRIAVTVIGLLGALLAIAAGKTFNVQLLPAWPSPWPRRPTSPRSCWSGPPSAAPFPLGNPAIVSIPIGFIGCVLGSLLGGRNIARKESFDEVRARSATGLGAEAGGAARGAQSRLTMTLR
jgi:cation/acetate symporter